VSYLLIFLASVGWSGHCIGMCGMFPLSLAAPGLQLARLLARQGLYIAGKTFTYVFLGVVAAWLGLYLQRWSCGVGLGAGILLVAIGLNTLGVFQRAKGFSAFLEATPLCAMLRGFMQQTSATAAFLLGLLNGFLPCPLTYAMMGMAATLHSMPQAAAVMAVFGLGTAPGLLAEKPGRGRLAVAVVGRADNRAGGPHDPARLRFFPRSVLHPLPDGNPLRRARPARCRGA